MVGLRSVADILGDDVGWGLRERREQLLMCCSRGSAWWEGKASEGKERKENRKVEYYSEKVGRQDTRGMAMGYFSVPRNLTMLKMTGKRGNRFSVFFKKVGRYAYPALALVCSNILPVDGVV